MKYHKKLILLESALVPSSWIFFDYGTKRSRPVSDWFNAQPEEVQDIFEALIKLNGKIDDPKNWNDSRKMEGELKKVGIWEYRVKWANVQYRLLGMFGSSRKQAIFLIGCTHKMKVYDPHDCLNTAIRRAQEVMAKGNGVILYERKIQEDI